MRLDEVVSISSTYSEAIWTHYTLFVLRRNHQRSSQTTPERVNLPRNHTMISSILVVCTVLASSVIGKPMVSSEQDTQKLYALAELLEAEEVAHKLEERLRDSLVHHDAENLADALDRLNYPEKVEKDGQRALFKPMKVVDDSKNSQYSLQFLDKRSKNFLKLANQAARGFGRK
uniref:Pigment dispersing factor n=1 Tax=Bursaphelenchus xylophilus TaxID=6326 RepID=A0A1I7SC49_BURXY